MPVNAMVGSVRDHWRHAEGYQRLCYVVGTLLVAAGMLHLLGFLLLGGPWVGPVAWRKPFAFGLSFGMTTITLAWMATYLRFTRRTGWVVLGALAAANTTEVVWVTVQRARGVASHFNTDSAVDAAAFFANGIAILVTIAVIVTLAARAFMARPSSAEPGMLLAIRAGLVILLVAQAVGGAMIANGLAALEGGATELTTIGAAGVPKVPHAVGMHAIQVLPALAWLLSFTALPAERRTALVVLGTVGYAALVGVSVLQTFTGLAPTDLGVVAGGVLVAGVALLGYAFATAVGALRRAPAVAPAGGLSSR